MEVQELHMVSLQCENLQNNVNNIKRMLMSRNTQLQMEAVFCILRSLKSFNKIGNNLNMKKPLTDVLLDSDVTEFLCEAMATINCHLLDYIFLCLEHLARSKKFYKNSHVVFVIECLARTIYFLLENDKSCHTLNRALYLLSGLLKGYVGIGSKALQACAFNVSQVLELLKNIVSNKTNSLDENNICVSMVLNCLLENEYLARQLDARLMEWLVTVLTKCLSSLSANVQNCKKMDLKLQNTAKGSVLLICNIASATLRLCSSLSSIMNVETSLENAIFEKYMGEIARMLLDNIENACAPYVLEAYIEESNVDLFNIFLLSLKCVYHEPLKGMKTTHLSHHLGKLGYLTLLPIILTWSSQRSQECNMLHPLCISVMEDLLFSMSVSTLDVEYLWPGGLKIFREHLHKGLIMLPTNYADWLNLLQDQRTSEPTQHALIILSFFSCLCASSIGVTAPYLPAVVSFLNSVPAVSTLPISITKAVWFVFAVSSLSYCGPVRLEKATNVLMHLLEYQTDIRNVYISHPAMLYWVFSSPCISSSLQKTVVNLWLENEEIDEKLVDLVSANHSAKFCLIDLTQCGTPHVVTKALTVLHYIILSEQKKGNNELLQILWEVLPHVLARASSSSTKIQAGNIGGLLQLTTMSVPQNISRGTVIRTVYVLTRLLVNETSAPLNFYRFAIHQAFLLLLVSMELQDKRVLAIYISEPKFLDILHKAVNADHPSMCSIALEFLSHLLCYQMKFQFLECDNSLKIDGRRMFELLGNPDMNILLPSLQLTSSLLQLRLASPVMKLSENLSVEFIRTLYIKLQFLCTKSFHDISSSSWKCLGGLLEFSSVHYVESNLKLHLATQPWTNFIICITAKSASVPRSHSFLQFVSQWLLCLQTCNGVSRSKWVRVIFKEERALCPNWLYETLIEVAKMMLRCKDLSTLSPATKELVLQITNRILESGIDLCEETKKSLTEHLQPIQSS